MKIPILGTEIDERFFRHRQRSTSIAGMAGAVVAGGLFFYRYFTQGILSWDLFAVITTLAVVKIALMVWYFLTD
jgi:ABC-type thiamin/hydroxymethylpyrimidine transport system permease subunit